MPLDTLILQLLLASHPFNSNFNYFFCPHHVFKFVTYFYNFPSKFGFYHQYYFMNLNFNIYIISFRAIRESFRAGPHSVMATPFDSHAGILDSNPHHPTKKGRETLHNTREGKPGKNNKGKENPTNHEVPSSVHSPQVGSPPYPTSRSQ